MDNYFDSMKKAVRSIESLLVDGNMDNKEKIMSSIKEILAKNGLSDCPSPVWVDGEDMYTPPAIVLKPELEITFFVKSMRKGKNENNI